MMQMQVVTLPTTVNCGHFDYSLNTNQKRNLFLSHHFAGTRNKLHLFVRLQTTLLKCSIAHDTDVLGACLGNPNVGMQQIYHETSISHASTKIKTKKN